MLSHGVSSLYEPFKTFIFITLILKVAFVALQTIGLSSEQEGLDLGKNEFK